MPGLVLYLLIFLAVGASLLAANLVLGRLVRPARPSAEKGAVYECGEPTIGSSWVQFDLRFYVVALLFVIFDVELAFFFPWAVVFGTANKLAAPELPEEARTALVRSLELTAAKQPVDPFQHVDAHKMPPPPDPQAAAARSLAWLAFADILVFFGVLVVGFAYLWRRGDLDWVRSTAGQEAETSPIQSSPVPAGAGLER